jgi:hypothetical protein
VPPITDPPISTLALRERVQIALGPADYDGKAARSLVPLRPASFRLRSSRTRRHATTRRHALGRLRTTAESNNDRNADFVAGRRRLTPRFRPRSLGLQSSFGAGSNADDGRDEIVSQRYARITSVVRTASPSRIARTRPRTVVYLNVRSHAARSIASHEAPIGTWNDCRSLSVFAFGGSNIQSMVESSWAILELPIRDRHLYELRMGDRHL